MGFGRRRRRKEETLSDATEGGTLRKVLLLAPLCMALVLVLSAPVMAQSASASASVGPSASACDVVQERLYAGDDSLTSAELLACGLSPEAISPTASVSALPETGGPVSGGPASVLALGSLALLVGSGIMAFGIMRRS